MVRVIWGEEGERTEKGIKWENTLSLFSENFMSVGENTQWSEWDLQKFFLNNLAREKI